MVVAKIWKLRAPWELGLIAPICKSLTPMSHWVALPAGRTHDEPH